MQGQRVLVTGMGGELGSLVATLLEDEPWVGEIAGVDANPPRRRLKRSTFHLIDPFDNSRVSEIILNFNPHVILHLGVWEPDARLRTRDAKSFSDQFARGVLEAAKVAPALQSLVLRSGVEVYGTYGHWPRHPDEHSALDPQSTFGHILVDLEQRTTDVAMTRRITNATLRFATIIGPHVPSPLGRLLRLPTVPYHPFGNPQFSVIGDLDAAKAIVTAARNQCDNIVNITAAGSISVASAANIGRRLAVPVIGPAWWVTRAISGIAGAPVPDHVHELLLHGRGASCEMAASLLGFTPQFTSAEIISRLYDWPSIVRIPSDQRVA